MKTSRPLFLLGAIAAASASLAAPVDTSAWKCKTCPYDKGASATVEVGVGQVSKQAARYSDYTGLDKGTHAVLGGSARMRNENGLFGGLQASELGLDSRALAGELGLEGLFSLRLAYDELPRHFSNAASTPFIGGGGAVLTLPAGFPANTTADMPLATTLQPIELGLKRKRADAGLSFQAGANWTLRMSLRQDVREGTRPGAGSFFADAAELPMPVDQVTNLFELGAIYASRQLQASVGYHVSNFDNGQTALTWANPFSPVLGGSTGQLALAPDNQFHQITASLGYEIAPKIRVTAGAAFGRMKQDEAFLAPTLNVGLAARLTPLPAQSLQGQVETFNANVKVTAAVFDPLRLSASYARDTRENDTPRLSYPAVATDMFVFSTPRTNRPYSFWQDRFKLIADYRAPSGMKSSAGIEQDYRERSYHEAVTTRETTLWGRVTAQPRDDLSLAFKLAHGQRKHSDYGVATWLDSPQNPLMRKYNLADRRRDSASARADFAISETVNLGFGAEFTNDDYAKSAVGLTEARSMNLGADLSVALSETTKVNAYVQADQVRSRQAGSQSFAQPDWTARNEDRFELAGVGLRHAIIANTLDVGADYTHARSRSTVSVDTGVSSTPQFPAATVTQDNLKVYATYKLQANLWLSGSLWHERYTSQDWRLDGVLPATVQNLLSFGEQSPQYSVNVVRVSLRYQF